MDRFNITITIKREDGVTLDRRYSLREEDLVNKEWTQEFNSMVDSLKSLDND